MNVRLSIILVVVLFIFGGTAYFVSQTRSSGRIPDEPWMFRIDESALVSITVSSDGQTVEYARKPGGSTWYIQQEPEVPVFIDKWSGTPLLVSGPRVNRVLGQTIDNPASFGLDPPVTAVTVVQRGGQSFEFHLGIKTPDENNQYARLVGDPQLFTVPEIWGMVITRLALEPPYPRLFSMEEEDLIYIEVTQDGKTESYASRLRAGAREWLVLLEDGDTPVDLSKWADIPAKVSDTEVYNVLANQIEEPESLGLEPPQITVKIGGRDGGIFVVYLGNTTPSGNQIYGQVVGQPELYAVPLDWVNTITGLVTDPPYTVK
ncbi:MAG: DUF4340 domain-containing protein [Chloroflexi bacterium]|nr:DUF4340 domain-containing protein [Chloroflexota bacterium]